MPDQSMTIDRATELEAEAEKAGQPTPRAAMAVLMARDAAALREAIAARDAAYLTARTRALRANYRLDAQGRGLPERHPDRLSLNDLQAVTGFDRTSLGRWLVELVNGTESHPELGRPDLIPTYRLNDQHPTPGALT